MTNLSATNRYFVLFLFLIVPGIIGFGCSTAEEVTDEADTDTTEARTVQPGEPGEATEEFDAERPAPEASRVVRPGAPGEETQVLTPGRSAQGQPARIVRPGAPGQDSEVEEGPQRDRSGEPVYSEADVTFMQEMILHHAQALQMTALVPDRTETESIKRMADRMERSQGDEIDQMLKWLERRGEESPEHLHHGHEHGDMHGMLSNEQMEELAAASGEEFDRLFLEYMIFHHEGAIHMVNELLSSPAGGQETESFAFASHVESDQRIEIQRMQQMLDNMP